VDTWCSTQIGNDADLFSNSKFQLVDHALQPELLLSPVPFLPLSARGACQFLPKTNKVKKKPRKHLRSELGIGSNDRLVLVCTADWQHSDFNDNDGNRLRDMVPNLVGYYLSMTCSKLEVTTLGCLRSRIKFLI
jgi:hypothetical protein